MTGMVCGPCAMFWCHQCTGLLRTQFGFCACADRDHLPIDASDVDKAEASRVNLFPSERSRVG